MADSAAPGGSDSASIAEQVSLRELALRQVADQVDRSLSSYMDEKEIQEA